MGTIVRLDRRRRTVRDDLGLSARAANLLAKAGIRSLDELLRYTWSDIDRIRGFGIFMRAELDDALSAKGLWLESRDRQEIRWHAADDDERADPIERLRLDEETVSVLRGAGVATVGNLVDLTLADLRRIDGVGIVMADEVWGALSDRGLHLRTYVRPSSGLPEPVHRDIGTTLEALYEHGYLSLRAINRLPGAGITTLADLIGRSAEDLRAIPGIGGMTVEQIRAGVRWLGFHLKGEQPSSPRSS